MLKDHNLTIGANGRITAEVHAKTVIIQGQLVGNITADDRVEITPSGSLQGDIRAPRVVLADGSSFKGSIDMDRKSGNVSTGAGTGAVAGAAAAVTAAVAASTPRGAGAVKG
jgi:cytoskeletal protein CcmA (bactofilin family)